MGVLDTLVDSLYLLDEDRDKLVKERGFTEASIDQYKIRSCTLNNIRIAAELRDSCDFKELVAAQIFVPHQFKDESWVPNKQLLLDNYLIPYLDEKNKVTKIRPHKFGFSGEGHKVFRTKASYKAAITCVIAESEFKAIAAEHYGYSAIGIPGITSMSGKNHGYFMDVLRTINAEKFVVLFDNEVKDDPNFPNYKERWQDRYDTMIYSYALANQIVDAGLQCVVATLPDAWREEGKIDIDGALAQGKQMHEFKDVIDAAVPPAKYLETMPIPDKHRGYINRRVKKFFFSNSIKILSNCFYKELPPTKEGEQKPPQLLANCSIKVKNVYEDFGNDNSIRRDMIVTDQYGLESKPIPILPAAMSTRAQFLQWLMGCGNYLFYGKDPDVVALWEYIFAYDESDIVNLLDRCGYVADQDMWLFKNMIIKDGEVYNADDQGISWYDDIGYQPKEMNSEEPALNLNTEGNFDIKEFEAILCDIVGDRNAVKIMIGWIIAVTFSPYIIKTFKFFPILFFYGMRQSGKTTIMRWLCNFFGKGDQIINLGISTRVGIQRALSYYSNLPVVGDDWREPDISNVYNQMFLGVYGRQSGYKGQKTPFGTRQAPIRGCLCLMGEHMVSDNGLQTRCVAFHISKEKRIKDRLHDMEAITERSPNFVYNLLTKHYKKFKRDLVPNIKKRVLVTKEKHNHKLDARVITNVAIFAEAYTTMFGTDNEFENYVDMLTIQSHSEMTQNDLIHGFANEFQFGLTENHLSTHHFKFSPDGSRIILWVSGIVSTMNKFYNRKVDNTQLLVKQFAAQPYFLRALKATFPGSTGKFPAVELDLTRMTDTLRDYFEGAFDGEDDTGGEA